MDKRKVFLAVVSILVILGVGSLVRLKNENTELRTEIQGLREDPQKAAKEETAKIVALVGKLVLLPADEEPVLATVTDKEKLKDQPLFAKAENGDKILIYSKAQKAYIYNPTKNVLVDVVPINLGQSQITITGVSASNPLRVALVNGSKTAGVTTTLEERLKDSNIPGLSVTTKATAKSSDYTKTLVLDLTGKWGTQAKEFAQIIGGVVATQSAEGMPANADLMVIIGADFK